jgi:hypothetical protein
MRGGKRRDFGPIRGQTAPLSWFLVIAAPFPRRTCYLGAPTYKLSRISARRPCGERGTQRSHPAPGANRHNCGVARFSQREPDS